MKVYCPACSSEISSIDEFCEKCGHKNFAVEKPVVEKLDIFQLTFFTSLILLSLVAIYWDSIPGNTTVILTILGDTVVFAVFIIIADLSSYNPFKLIFILFIAGIFYSILIFNVFSLILSIIGMYFCSKDLGINPLELEKRNRKPDNFKIISSQGNN